MAILARCNGAKVATVVARAEARVALRARQERHRRPAGAAVGAAVDELAQRQARARRCKVVDGLDQRA